MQTNTDKTFNNIVEQFLGKRLPDEMATSFLMSNLPPDAQDFIKRTLTLMKRSGYSVTGFTPHLIRWLTVTVPSILPSAWGGRIPPLTLPGRHKKLDDYVTKLKAPANEPSVEPSVFVDVGCGFPPATSADTARKLPNWHIYGIDRSFADYVLYDVDGHYACFDQKGAFQYFQALMNNSGRALYADPEGAKNRFNELFGELFPLMKISNSTKSESVEKDGNRLIHNHIRDFETDNLTFIKSDLTDLRLPPVKVIRCMNILIYFEPKIRKKMLLQAGELLEDDGIIIVGTNGLGNQTRYAIYRKNKNGLCLDEFAFSIDNIGHIAFMAFFAIHEDDPEAALLADLTRAIRANQPFWSKFSKRQDDLLKEHGICQRQSDGFLHFPEDEIPPAEYIKRITLLWQQMEEEGYLNRAVDVLLHAGYDAWVNSVGDITIRPPADFMI